MLSSAIYAIAPVQSDNQSRPPFPFVFDKPISLTSKLFDKPISLTGKNLSSDFKKTHLPMPPQKLRCSFATS